MELDRISVVLRPRTPREAVDLGTVMLRANARAVWSAWFAFSLPIAAACIALGCLIGHAWLGIVLIWWLTPLFDRIPLYVLSRAAFDRAPGWRDALRGQRRMPWGVTWAALSWRRVDTHRALRLPLELLEGLSGKRRSTRWRILRRQIGGSATMLTLGCLQLELVLFLSVFLLIVAFVPHELVPDTFRALFSDTTRQSPTAAIVFASVVAYLSISVMEPWYVASGFGLYLTRRTQLEAWDIDLSFRRIRERLESAGRVLALLLVCTLISSRPSPVLAADVDKPTAPSTQVEQAFKEPLSADDHRFADAARHAYGDARFGQHVQAREWVLRNPPKPEKIERVHVDAGQGEVGNFFAGGLNILLWLMLGVVVVLLLIFAFRYARTGQIRRVSMPRKLSEATETELAAIAPLPDDLAAAVRGIWQAGGRREALALLYRGCVEQVAATLDVALADDATEADCLRRARTLPDGEQSRRAVAIVRAWQYAAYADRFPSEGEVDTLLSGWPAQSRSRA